MKTFALFFIGLSSLIFAQQKVHLVEQQKDSLAVQNVNSIIQKSKDLYSFSNLNDTQTQSDIQKNTFQLLRNDFNYNAAIKPRFMSPANQEFQGNYIPQNRNGMVRTLMSVPIYRSK